MILLEFKSHIYYIAEEELLYDSFFSQNQANP